MIRIHLLHELGIGSMGLVYKARVELPFARPMDVAVKFLQRDRHDEMCLLRFAREAETALLHCHRHPNLLTTFWCGVTERKQPYLVVELADISLRALHKDAPLETAMVFRIARDMLRALGYLHKQGVQHRDVSAGNILLSRSGTVMLGDFGLVQRPSGSIAGHPRGTPEYMSPETLDGRPYTASSDLYSLGAVLYELVMGQPPHGRGDSAKIHRAMQAALEKGNVLPSLRDDLDPHLVALIHGLLQREPRNRPTVARASSLIEASGQPVASDEQVTALVDKYAPRDQEGNSHRPTTELTLHGAVLRANPELLADQVTLEVHRPPILTRRRAWTGLAVVASLFLGLYVLWTTPTGTDPINKPARPSVDQVDATPTTRHAPLDRETAPAVEAHPLPVTVPAPDMGDALAANGETSEQHDEPTSKPTRAKAIKPRRRSRSRPRPAALASSDNAAPAPAGRARILTAPKIGATDVSSRVSEEPSSF